MRFVGDFHIHSKYSRAVSKDMDLENLDKWARIKGIGVLGTGDFTHPLWFKELREKLEPAEPGLFRLRPGVRKLFLKKNHQEWMPKGGETRFLLTVEISSIYSRGGKVRKIHNLIFAPSLPTAEKINAQLGWIGNLKSDGRPILGVDSEELAKIVFAIDPTAVIIPAHAWTPWFSVFGSMSGFDSLEECFGKYTKQIFAIETGLSSDPAMNWRLSKLDTIALTSNSDAHSPTRIGREANVFDAELSYAGIIGAIRSRDPQKFLFTVEFYPEEGKYHYDGHRVCKVSWAPEETKKAQGKCSSCGRPVTVGVMHRVEKLADRPVGTQPANIIPFKNLVPLDQIIAEALGTGVAAKGVMEEYKKLIRAFGTEFTVLLEASSKEIERVSSPEVAEGVRRVRDGKLHIEPGYDGEYGKVQIFTAEDRLSLAAAGAKQATLF